jgi:hypothetical protein
MISGRLLSVNELVDEGLEEGGFNVELIGVKLVAGGKCEHESNSCRFGYGGKGFVVVFAGFLGKATGYQTGLVGRSCCIGIFELPDELG